jgi:hypothetical protein
MATGGGRIRTSVEHPEADLTDIQPYSEAEVKELRDHPEVQETSEESEKAS